MCVSHPLARLSALCVLGLLLVGLPGVGRRTVARATAPGTSAPGTWSPTGSMASGRDYHTATLLPNSKVLIAGGQDSSGLPLATAEL